MKKKKEKTRSRIHFVRVYSFYVSQKKESWTFQVTVKCFSPLNKLTGMSVDLTNLDRVADLIFTNDIGSSKTLSSILQKRVNLLRSRLRKIKVHLMTVHFDECRNFGIHFIENNILFVRLDLAKSESGDLHEVVSYLDSKQTVVKLQLKNFRTKITEQIIF